MSNGDGEWRGASETRASATQSWAEPELRRIRRLANEESAREKARDVIVFVGSSIFREWREMRDFERDWLSVGNARAANRAFGGATTWDLLDAFDDVMSANEREARKIVVYYCGSNDISNGVKPERAVENFEAFARRARETSAKSVGFAYVGVIDSPQKRLCGMSDAVRKTNALAKALCEANAEKNYAFVDVTRTFEDADGASKTNMFRDDCTHLKPESYDALKECIEPVLLGLIARVFAKEKDESVVRDSSDFLPPKPPP